jgi:NADPH:quinone reductase-like Zn-dependent oxidoreductase
MNETMRAWQAVDYGSAEECLRLAAVNRPEPGPGEVRLRVQAASLNPIDYKLLHGDLRRIQKLSFPVTLGFDASGVIDALGQGAGKFQVGDRVFVRASRDSLGAFAEYSVQPEKFVALSPRNVSAAAAASLPLVALTTVQGLVDRAQAKPGQRILIHAGSGGLGSFAVQYAKCLGLSVDSTTSSRNTNLVKALGADYVIAYDLVDYRDTGAVYDIVFDTLGGKHTLDAFAVLKPGGCVVSVAGPPDHEMAAKFGGNFLVRTIMKFMARKVYAAAHAKQARYYRFLTESNGMQLKQVAALVEHGSIKPVVDRIFAFEDCIAAFNYLMGGRAKGKVVIDVENGEVFD